MPFNATKATVENEGCNLHYWYQGSGPLLIMIPGGSGHAAQFFPIFEYLDKHFTICTYDRRQMSASTVKEKAQLNPAQSARDAEAITKAMGKERASIFGNSGGGIIAFQFAVSYPDALDHVMVHEAPSTIFLDDATYHLDRAFMLMELYRTQGAEAAGESFRTEMKGDEDWQSGALSNLKNMDNFWANEFMQFTIYCPDLRKIVDNKVSISVAAGEKSRDAFYARTTFPQSEILACPRYVLPGNHSGYEHEPATFAPELLKAFNDMESRKNI
ncbi:Alpha/Beta hydrolase fold [Lasallia pustulata]|uniref:Alpha/Beta hydrolase fold n=1 Tax=Lasallia pustulata TaxID=136370 RepID=A0A1W5CXU4_9LECA|nr:Alpha/Beta hydrolase fold [Lasallia pustulata]